MGTPLQNFIAGVFTDLIESDFMEASNHPGSCRCDICLEWWVQMGPDEDSQGEPSFGPFTKEEFLAAGGTIPTEEAQDE